MGIFDGRNAIVTGAGRGIGRGHAQLLAAEGARVVVNDLDRAEADAVVKEIIDAGGEAVANTDNVATWAGGEAIVQQAIDTFGSLDILVNNAGILRDAMTFNLTEEEWDAVINVHLKGHMSTCRAAAVHFRQRAKAGEEFTGRIINTTSESGMFGQAGQVNYSAAKAGIISMTLVLAREFRKYNVTANCVCPRALTRMTASVPGADEYMQGPEWNPDNIAPVVCFLASDEAADVNGQVIVVWGSRVHLMEGWTKVNTLDRGEGRWTPQELIAKKDELFDGRRSKVPFMGFGE